MAGRRVWLARQSKEQTVTEKLSYKSRMVLNELGIFVNAQTTITYRLIRVLLPPGEVEVLLTTLIDARRFKHGYFSEIYRKRWGIETCFLVIKSFLELANFSAYTVNNCWQSLPRFFRGYLCALHQLQYPNGPFHGKGAGNQKTKQATPARLQTQPERRRRATQTLPC